MEVWWHKQILQCIDVQSVIYLWLQVPHVEGRAGMAAIVDTDGTFDLATFVKGIQENLPTYARPLFIRVLSQLQMTGKCSTYV